MLISHAKRNAILDGVRRIFGGQPARVQVAALPWREGPDGIEIMLITSRGTGRWVLPKGWPEGGEQLSQAAAREAAEEAGLDGEIAASEAGCYFYGKVLRSGSRRRCEVHVFPLKVKRVARTWPEKNQRERRWTPVREAAAMVAERDLGELIAAFGGGPRQFA